MDNHRAALWCWFQHFTSDDRVNLIHIDAHSDTLYSKIDKWVSLCPNLWEISLDEYLAFNDVSAEISRDVPLFSWQNFGSIFLEKYESIIDECIYLTQGKGEKPKAKSLFMPSLWQLPWNIDCWLGDQDKWICDIDIDYFFYQSGDNSYHPLFSDEYIEQLFENLKRLIDKDKIIALTIALSPECCNSWEQAESMCYKICEIMKLDFQLPILDK